MTQSTMSVAILTDRDARVLVIRRRNTGFFTQPDAPVAPNGDPLDTLRRGLWDDLGLSLPRDSFALIGTFGTWAIDGGMRPVNAEVYAARAILTDITPQDGIAEAVWVHSDAPHVGPLAPLTEEMVLPRILDAITG